MKKEIKIAIGVIGTGLMVAGGYVGKMIYNTNKAKEERAEAKKAIEIDENIDETNDEE